MSRYWEPDGFRHAALVYLQTGVPFTVFTVDYVDFEMYQLKAGADSAYFPPIGLE
jgi:hypothetical protein